MTGALSLPPGFVGAEAAHVCERCAHWHRFGIGDMPQGATPAWGWCRHPIDTKHVAAPFPPDRDGNDRMHTHADYGCNRWEPAE